MVPFYFALIAAFASSRGSDNPPRLLRSEIGALLEVDEILEPTAARHPPPPIDPDGRKVAFR